ncbi:hypothetical protein IMSHALPRED_000759 [Imshaugia aleurites]|uniref:Aminoglycoside phosphotransferase domain-containing protein n=1 Tax=Imshaugia aleurites TaxID=172621 RepID=A0A8H3IYD7_9LECA|nr:hypothetical protein IMSHALPRED_000759 [Imshaugia aleurites]
MALKIQADPEIILPQGWDESEQMTINNLFDERVPKVAKTTCSASECRIFAQTLMQGKELVLVNNQGFHSYTLACPENNQIIQFRLKDLCIKHIDEAKEIYGDLVSQVVHHSGFNLPVYTMDIVPGVAHFWQESPRTAFPLERELNTVVDLAKFTAAPSHFLHPLADCKESSKTNCARAIFTRLEQNSSLRQIAPEIYAEVTSLTARLNLLESLPLVLTHPDLVGLNVFVDRITGNITGVIDFDDAQIEALGMNMVTLYEWFVGSMEDGHWSPYDMPAGGLYGSKKVCQVLEAAFWNTFWANTSPDLKEEGSKEALSVALRVGIVNRYIVDGGMLDEVDLEKGRGDERSLDYARGILLHLRDSGI